MAQAKIEKRRRKAIARLRKKTLTFVRNLLARTGRILAHSAVGGMFLVATSVPAQETMEHGIAEVKATLQQAAENATPAPDAKTGGDLGAISVQRTITIRIEKTAGQKGAGADNRVSLGSESKESNWWNRLLEFPWVLVVGLILFGGRKYFWVVLRLIASYLFDVVLFIWGRPLNRPSLPVQHEPDEIYAQQREIKTQKYRQESLFEAIARNNASQIEALVGKGADVNAWDEGGFTPLGVAAQYGATAAITKLVELGADVNMPNKHGLAPLDSAAIADSASGILKLVELGANINGNNLRGITPLHRAAHNGKKDNVRELLGCGADINVRNDAGWTPMHWAATKNKKENMLLVNDLCERGADINARDKTGYTPAHMAALRNCPAIIKILWIHDANIINAKAKNGETPHDVAELSGNIRVLFRIIMCGGKKGKDLPPDTAAK